MPSRRYSAADLQAMIPLYLDGVLDAEERAAVEAYWSEHPDAALAHFAVSGSLIDLLDEVVTPRPVDDAFVDDVMAAIHDLTPARRRRERWAMTAPLTMVRWLAETSLVLLLGWLLLTHPWAPAVSAVECRLLGDATWVLGRPAAVRVLVTARGSQTPVVNAEVRLRLQHPHQLWRTTVFRGRTNEQGTLDTDVRLEPAVPAGDCWLLAEVDSPRGRATAWHALTLAQRWKLTVEPVADRVPAGGRVVARVALSDAGSGKPGRGPVTWRLDDAHGTGLASGSLELSERGQAVLDLPVGETIAPGVTTLWVRGGDTSQACPLRVGSPARADLAVQVTPRPAWAAAGGRLTGAVRVTLPPAENVSGATVRVALRVGEHVVVADGRTDSTGSWSFALRVPRWAGRTTLASLTATVVDARGRGGQAELTLPAATSPVRLTLTPVSMWVAGLPSRVFVTAERPDGTPYTGDVDLWLNETAGQAVELEAGCGYADVQPRAGTNRWELVAQAGGDELTAAGDESALTTEQGLAVLPETTRWPANRPLRVEVVAAGGVRAVLIDLVAGGQTVLTRDLNLARGRGELVLRPPAGVDGSLLVRAYALDSRRHWRQGLARVQLEAPARLRLAARKDGTDPARLRWTARDGAGQPAAVDLVAMATALPGPGAGVASERPVRGSTPGFSLQASSGQLAAQRGLDTQQRFFHRSPWYGGGVGGLLLLALFAWLYQLFTDPFECVSRAERRAWGSVPQVHRRGTWAGIGVLAVGLATAMLLTGGVLLAGRQARQLAQAAQQPAARWQPPLRPWPTLLADAAEANLAAARIEAPRSALSTPRGLAVSHEPDSLLTAAPAEGPGRWLVQATARDAEGGAATATAEVTTPGRPWLHLAAPPRLHVGDVVALPLTLVNPSPDQLTAALTMTTDAGLVLTAAPTQRVTCPPRSRLALSVPVRGSEFGRPTLAVKAVGDGWQTRVETPLEILPAAPRVTRVSAGPLLASRTYELALPPGATARAVRVRCDTEPLAAWDRLLERVADRPTATAAEALGAADAEATRWQLWHDADRLTPAREAALRPRLQRSWQALLRYETVAGGRPTGGFATRPAGRASLAVTAQALLVLRRIDAVQPIDPQVARRVRAWVTRAVRHARPAPNGQDAPDALLTSALAVAALASRDEGDQLVSPRPLATLRAALATRPDLAALALATTGALVGQSEATVRQELLDQLAERRTEHQDGSRWYSAGPLPTGAAGRGAELETTAWAVAALARAGDGRHLRWAVEGARYLATQQCDDGTWGSAWLTAQVVRALHAATPTPSPARGTLVATIDGRQAQRVGLDSGQPTGLIATSPEAGAKTLTLRFAGRGRPSCEVEIAASQSAAPKSTGGLAAAVTVDHDTTGSNGALTAVLTVTNHGPRGWPAVQATVPLPPGFELVGPVTRRDGAAHWALGPLSPGQSRRLTLSLRAAGVTARVQPFEAEVRAPDDPDARAVARWPRLSAG